MALGAPWPIACGDMGPERVRSLLFVVVFCEVALAVPVFLPQLHRDDPSSTEQTVSNPATYPMQLAGPHCGRQSNVPNKIHCGLNIYRYTLCDKQNVEGTRCGGSKRCTAASLHSLPRLEPLCPEFQRFRPLWSQLQPRQLYFYRLQDLCGQPTFR